MMSMRRGPMRRLATGFGLLEAARWYPAWGLVFSDVTSGGVFALGADEVVRPVIEFRKGIGGLVAHEHGGIVVTGRNVAWKGVHGAESAATSILLEKQADEAYFNDAAADEDGRLYVGSVAFDPTSEESEAAGPHGRLYRIDTHGVVDVLADDVRLSNGLAVSPDSTTLYHADSLRRTIWAYDITSTEAPSRRTFVDTSNRVGLPDGLAVAEDGSVWAAMAEGGLVMGWDTAGRELAQIEVPQPLSTSLCFGGAERRSMFVVTGGGTGASDLGGSVYVHEVDVPGVPCWPTRVPGGPN